MKTYLKSLALTFACVFTIALNTNAAFADNHGRGMAAGTGGTKYECEYPGGGKPGKCTCKGVNDCLGLKYSGHCKDDITNVPGSGGQSGQCTANKQPRPSGAAGQATLKGNAASSDPGPAPKRIVKAGGGATGYKCFGEQQWNGQTLPPECVCDGVADCLKLSKSGKCKGDVSLEDPNDPSSGKCAWGE